MKRILPALLVALAAFAYACQTTPTNTNNRNGNANVNASPEIKRANHEKEIKIRIANSTPVGRCAITVDPLYQFLDGTKDKVIWSAENDCDAAGAQLIIGDFKSISNPSENSPFGNDPYDNRFVFDPINKGDEGRLISKVGKKPGKYEYTLRIVGTRNEELGKLDPQIEIGAR